MAEESLQENLGSQPFPSYCLASRHPQALPVTDILTERQSLKEEQSHGLSLSYFDSFAGRNPIVGKLPTGLQGKWITHACIVNYNQRNGTYFPPFTEFTQFVRQQSRLRNNDPCFKYDTCASKREHPNSSAGLKWATRSPLTTTKVTCPIGLDKARHSLSECKAFRAKPTGERRQILKKNVGCFRCCQLGRTRQDMLGDYILCDCDCDCDSENSLQPCMSTASRTATKPRANLNPPSAPSAPGPDLRK